MMENIKGEQSNHDYSTVPVRLPGSLHKKATPSPCTRWHECCGAIHLFITVTLSLVLLLLKFSNSKLFDL